ncbi:protein pirA-like [Synchiropus splendidus]|uniref:protein pirA-like n=1 Tax=Synchiropus splendidus TaxID=270530 RepID=UPI00237E7263|nr:protein pirA-like [Synchiropus splendidus]XP_053728309.1 protein pirA-like [Synchiropus splendidus]XP_053728310.1 protein pirA-like [Synchiropus splendidus]
MDDTLISAVAACPVLYDPQCPFYQDRNRKELAWREVSKTIDVPVEICKKWKGLRDIYMREKMKAMEKKSGSVACSQVKWRRFAVLSFLDPFITPRETSGNMTAAAPPPPAADHVGAHFTHFTETCHHVDDEEEEEFEETLDEGTEPPASSSGAAASSAPPPSPAAGPSTSSAGPRKQKRKRSSTSSVEEEAPPPSAEE